MPWSGVRVTGRSGDSHAHPPGGESQRVNLGNGRKLSKMIATQGISTLSLAEKGRWSMGGHRLPQPRGARKEGAKSNGKESRMCPPDIPADLTKRCCAGCSQQSQSHSAVDGEVIADRECGRASAGRGSSIKSSFLLVSSLK